jgi:hypothetical protein
MLENNHPDDPAVLLIADLHNQYSINRRGILKLMASGAIAVAFAGCASTSTTARVAKHVAVKVDQNLLAEPKDNAKVTGQIARGEQARVLDQEGDWIKIRGKSGAVGWLKISHCEIIEYVERTMPCGSPIPSGAICTCNCVPRYTCSCNPHSYRVCSCVPVCTCNTVPVFR